MTHIEGIYLYVALWYWRDKCVKRYKLDIISQKNQESRHKHYFLFDVDF